MRSLDESDPIAAETVAERERLVLLLSQLSPEQWAAPSLCAGWRVREVVAHITLAYRHSPVRVLAGIVAARGRFNDYSDRIAKKDTATTTDAALLASLRDNVRHPWKPPGGGQVGALSHDVIHGLDITEPLGLPPVPADRIALVLQNATPAALAYFGAELDGRRLVATDAEITVGDGPAVHEMPARDLLLTVTGRRPMPA